MIKVALLTISDTCSQGGRVDVSGETIAKMLLDDKRYDIVTQDLVADEIEQIVSKFKQFSDELKVDLVISTGGTGLGPRDVTPEATLSICDRIVPGIGEATRAVGFQKTPNAMLSRSVAGVRNNTLIINLPGSPKAVAECLEIILTFLPHAAKMMYGEGH